MVPFHFFRQRTTYRQNNFISGVQSNPLFSSCCTVVWLEFGRSRWNSSCHRAGRRATDANCDNTKHKTKALHISNISNQPDQKKTQNAALVEIYSGQPRLEESYSFGTANPRQVCLQVSSSSNGKQHSLRCTDFLVVVFGSDVIQPKILWISRTLFPTT